MGGVPAAPREQGRGLWWQTPATGQLKHNGACIRLPEVPMESMVTHSTTVSVPCAMPNDALMHGGRQARVQCSPYR